MIAKTPSDDFPPEAVPGLVEYSAREQRRRFTLPAGFADQITTQSLRQRTRRIQSQWVVGLTLAASVLLAVGVVVSGTLSKRTPDVVLVTPAIQPPSPAPTKVQDQLAEAGKALRSLTIQTTEKAVGPTKTLFKTPSWTSTTPEPEAPNHNPTGALAALPAAARSSLDPVANTTRRAMNRLLVDVGFRNQ